MRRYLNAKEAADELGVTPATLYAYVSRGLIRSEETGEGKRSRRYYAEDIQKLKARKEGRRHPEKVAQASLHYGAPVLESAITLIANGRLYYRGYDALELAVSHSIEAVAALLWTGVLDAESIGLSAENLESLSVSQNLWHDDLSGRAPVERFQVLLPLAAMDDLAAYDLRTQAVIQTGTRILALLARTAAGKRAIETSFADTLRRGWTPDHPDASRLLNAALILCADHELNVSAFTARVVASAGSTPYHVVIAGLAALLGVKHGGYTERVEALLREAGTPSGVRGAMAGRLKRGEPIPGFGHRLYPDGDPRAALLIKLVFEAYPDSPAVELAQAALAEASSLVGEQPTIDFGLAALARALQLPAGCALAIFALGRTIGWIGHAIEQYDRNRLIRPRARYIGTQPGEV